MRRSTWPRTGRIALGTTKALRVIVPVALLVAGCSSGGSASSEPVATDEVTLPRSQPPTTATPEDPFCAAYWGEALAFRSEWTATATQDPVLSLIKLIGAPNDLARLFERITPAAPAELQGDLSAIQEEFDSTFDNAGDAVSNPLGYLFSGAISGLAINGSFERVNGYLNDNCTIPPELVNAGGVATSAACQRVADLELSPESTLDEFLAFTSDIEAAGPTAAEPARILQAEVQTLSPPARFGYEALGRLRFSAESEPDRLFTEMVAAAVNECSLPGLDVIVERADAILGDLLPNPDQEFGTTLFGRCIQHNFLAPASITYACNGQVEAIDMNTGVVTLVGPEQRDYSLDGSVGWTVNKVVQPAEGLGEPSWSATLNLSDFRNSSSSQVLLVDSAPGEGDNANLEVDASSTLVAYTLDSTLRIVALNGTPVDEFTRASFGFATTITDIVGDVETIDFGSAEFLPNGALEVYHALIDPQTGATLTSPEGYFRTTACGQTILEEGGNITVVGANLSLGPATALPRDGSGRISDISTRILGGGYATSTDGLTMHNWDGSTRWNLNGDVVDSYGVLFDWIVVENKSGEFIVVDPYTGSAAEGLDQNAVDFLIGASTTGRDYSDVVLVDFQGGVVFTRDGVPGFWKLAVLPLPTLCPTDWSVPTS